jgi:NMD protein affecting ribosome stability and mRNA decay
MTNIEEQSITTGYPSSNVAQRCLECGKKISIFIAYIPNLGEVCMDCYVEAAKKDEADN